MSLEPFRVKLIEVVAAEFLIYATFALKVLADDQQAMSYSDDPSPDGTFPDRVDERSECQNCRLTWDEDELKEIKHLSERVAPGEPMPSGECPECKALCHPLKTP